MQLRRVPTLLAGIALCGVATLAADEPTLHNTEIYESPWAGETPSKGTITVRHEGEGEPPETGYFKKHEPGEVAEFHLFVPDGIPKGQKVPLLIVYHGGKDGASGKGMLGGFSKLSTTAHPVIVLSPNMYTMDAMNELLDEEELPIDTNRIVVYGHSSGGMGIAAAMREYVRTKGAFTPAALIAASTTASIGRVKYPPCTYYVLAGEKETPEFVKSQILKERRRTCRMHALVMQQVIEDVRYIEIKDSGHSGGTPAHKAVIQHALAVSERAPVRFEARTKTPELEDLVAAATDADWEAVYEEMDQLEGNPDLEPRAEYEKLRSKILDALRTWFAAETQTIATLTARSSYLARDRAFERYDRCVALAGMFDDTDAADDLAAALAALGKAEHWSAELAARETYRKIVSGRPREEMKKKLAELRASAPDTEYGRNRTREKLLALEEVQPEPVAAEVPDGPEIINPYYPKQKWRVWRDDETPIEGVGTLVHEGKEKKQKTITLQPTPVAERIYPAGPLTEGQPIKWEVLSEPSQRFAGMWDDVYASWSGLHGYVRSSWQTTAGDAVQLRGKVGDQIMHFVERRKTGDLQRCGINFVHQSTTGMAHTIVNGYGLQMTTTYERIYFADCLVTGPAHASYTEEWADRTKDLFIALAPTIFNSVGSSNSETMAITKMMIVGGYLPPESKRILKRNGLYPSALLYMWKASLPYDVPYESELRHRIAYRALGREDQFQGKYGHAGGERGNLALEFHRYDELAHMRGMIQMAQDMTVLPPEAILDDVEIEGGTKVYALEKTVLVLQEPGQDVTIRLSTNASYDLQGRDVTVRPALLYGNHETTCEPGDEPGTWIVRVPWDDALPEGRTALVFVANNGAHDGNPAVVNVFRKIQKDLPPNGQSPGNYAYTSPTANRRPVLLNLQDLLVTPGTTVTLPLRAVDPEGQPVRFYKRAGEPGTLDGNLFTFDVPKGAADTYTVTFMASDATAGNSYAAKRIDFVAKQTGVTAHIESDVLVGPAPLTVTVSAEGSSAATGKLEYGWEFYTPTPKGAAADWKKLPHDAETTHTFDKPGLYEIALTARSGKLSDRETISVWVTSGPPPAPVGGIVVEGRGVRVADGDEEPSTFDGTLFGKAGESGTLTRVFELFNRGAEDLSCNARTVTVSGANAAEFRVVAAPRKTIEAGGYGTFAIEFRPRGGGTRRAEIIVRAGVQSVRFAVAGEASVDQGVIDAEAGPAWKAARALFEERKWAEAEAALAAFVERWPGASASGEAEQLLERVRTDPEIRRERDAAAAAEASRRDRNKSEKRAKSLLSMAENSLAAGRRDIAEKYWNEIIEKYPDTPQAAEARRRLGR